MRSVPGSPSAKSKYEKEVVCAIARRYGVAHEARFARGRDKPHIEFKLQKLRPWNRVVGHRDRVRLENLEKIESWARNDVSSKRNIPVLFCSKDNVEEANFMAVLPAEEFFYLLKMADLALMSLEAVRAEDR